MPRYVLISLLLLCLTAQAQEPCASTIDSVDPVYGGKIRQLVKPDGHEHNLYYYRNPWNADNTLMVGVQTDLTQQIWHVVLYNADGCLIKELFPITQFDWKIVWDRHDPQILYTRIGNGLYRFNVASGEAELIKSFAPLNLKPNGPSINQTGDRILIITSDNIFRSYRLPDMDDERTFSLQLPTPCGTAWDKERYIGYCNYIVVQCQNGTAVYNDTGALVRMFESAGGGGHHDFSGDGKWAYFTYSGAGRPLEIHVVNVDGSDDRVVFRLAGSQTRYVHNLHLAWPSGVSDWFIASFFPNAQNLPSQYAPYVDEIVQIRTDGTHRILARSGTAYSAVVRDGGPLDMFWAQPLARPNSHGTRINFNSNRSGTIDQHILYSIGAAAPPALTSAGVVNAASFAPGLTPGSIVSVFGTNLSSVDGILNATGVPLPTELAGTSVSFNGVRAPILTVANRNGQGQVNVQAPWELAGLSMASVVVVNREFSSTPVDVPVTAIQPGVFTFDGGWGAVLHSESLLPVTREDPALRGEVVLIFATGLGPVNGPPPTGRPASAEPLSHTTALARVIVGSRDSAVQFSGLAPAFVGLYQINARVAEDAPLGDQDLLLEIGGQVSRPVKISVR